MLERNPVARVDELLQCIEEATPEVLNFQNQADWTPLRLVICKFSDNEAEVIVRKLLSCGANPTLPARKGLIAPIHDCSRKAYQLCLTAFVEAHPGLLSQKSDGGLVPLHYAAKNGDHTMIQYLVTKGAEVNAVTAEGLTPLHYAAEAANLEACVKLVANGAITNALTRENNSPAHYAGAVFDKAGSQDVLEFLIKSGCDPLQRNSEGHSAVGKYLKEEVRRKIRSGFVSSDNQIQAICDIVGCGCDRAIDIQEAMQTSNPADWSMPAFLVYEVQGLRC